MNSFKYFEKIWHLISKKIPTLQLQITTHELNPFSHLTTTNIRTSLTFYHQSKPPQELGEGDDTLFFVSLKGALKCFSKWEVLDTL